MNKRHKHPGRHTLTKDDRILKRSEYLHLAETGTKLHGRHFLIIYHTNPRGIPRLGVTVTKKVGGAVVRNRIKRMVREFFRQNRYRITGGWDINIIAKQSAVDLESRQVSACLSRLFDMINGGGDD